MTSIKSIEDWKKERENANAGIMAKANREIKRFFNLDTNAYKEGALSVKTKELLGLVASLVLRCDDCITYHIIQSVLAGVNDEEFYEAFNVGLIVGGSIVIPHLRRATQCLEECRQLQKENPSSLTLESPK